MTQWGFYFNQDRCLGCKACILACQNWNEKNRGDKFTNPSIEEYVTTNPNYYAEENKAQPTTAYIDKSGALNTPELAKLSMKEGWRKVTTLESGSVNVDYNSNTFTSDFNRAHISISCNHCAKPACVDACPMALIYKEPNTGIVLYDSTGCLSCGRCREACPWSSPNFYDENFAKYAHGDRKRPRMTKCTGCFDRITSGLKPACVAGCRARALDFGPLEELKKKYNNNYVTKIDGFDTDNTQPSIIFRVKTNDIS